ncbi:MAG: peptide-methionine (S)-S-oxide reductase MsrA [Saprospiraceae bacterium]|nr:peptide-methionine (S)-S-oxide reductase MsrA [Saprospiraceae bacterium]
MLKFLILYITIFLNTCNESNKGTVQLQKVDLQETHKMKENQLTNYDTITFGAGCFWCTEAVFQNFKGVEKVVSGYMGGDIKNPSYREICTGTTGHAEVCQILFDPAIITVEQLIEILWISHDPTTLNAQGNDRGTQYRSSIFYHNESQKAIAETSKREVATKYWDQPIVTEITKASVFYKAEDYHQNYYNDNSEALYCQYIISPKLQKVKEKYAKLLK